MTCQTRCAIIDIGSNTARINIYDADGQEFVRILTQCEELGILNFIENRTLSEEGVRKLLETLRAFSNLAQRVACSRCHYLATAGLRSIGNFQALHRRAEEELGVHIERISGDEEALLSFSGLKYGVSEPLRSGIMVDLGGGSTELLGFVDGMAVRAQTLPFGSLSLYRQFVSAILPEKADLREMKSFLDRRISEVCWLKNYGNTAYLVGGSARAAETLVRLAFPSARPNAPHELSYEELKALYDRLREADSDTIHLLVRSFPSRLHTLVPGILELLRIAKFAEVNRLVISSTGIREGYLVQRILSQTGGAVIS